MTAPTIQAKTMSRITFSDKTLLKRVLSGRTRKGYCAFAEAMTSPPT